MVRVQALRADLLLALETEEDEVLAMQLALVLIVEVRWQSVCVLLALFIRSFRFLLHLVSTNDLAV